MAGDDRLTVPFLSGQSGCHMMSNVFVQPVLKEDEVKYTSLMENKAKHGGPAWGFLSALKLTVLSHVIGCQAACVSRISL